jgi:MoaA/NifB/PqqE/SkfB family radical SAM enzyme
MKKLDAMPPRHPVNATLELTLRCNLKCKMCMFRHSDCENARLAGEELTAAQWAHMARQMFDAGTLNVLITGGEPMLRGDFCEIYSSIYRLGFLVTLYTNATLVTEQIMQTLRQYPPHRIGITFYGASNETYGALCGCPDGFDRALAGARALATLPSALEFRTTPARDNFKELSAVEALVRQEFDLPVTHSTTVFQSVRGGCMPVASCRLTPEQTVELTLNRTLDRVRGLLPENRRGQVQLRLTEVRPECADPAGYTLLGCGGGMNNVTVTCSGQLLGCQMLGCFSTDAVKLGFAEAWEQWPYTVRLPQINPECGNCPDLHVCAVCPGVRMAECGDLRSRPEYICQITKCFTSRKGENLL